MYEVLCFCKTFISQYDVSLLKLQNYKLAAFYCREKQRRGGTCIFVKFNINYICMTAIKTFSISQIFECCGVEIINYRIIIICIYRIPDRNNIRVFFNSLNNLLEYLFKKYKGYKIIVCGDWNINIIKCNNITDELESLLQNYNLKIKINIPTRRNACLDVFACNIIEALGTVQYLGLATTTKLVKH